MAGHGVGSGSEGDGPPNSEGEPEYVPAFLSSGLAERGRVMSLERRGIRDQRPVEAERWSWIAPSPHATPSQKRKLSIRSDGKVK